MILGKGEQPPALQSIRRDAEGNLNDAGMAANLNYGAMGGPQTGKSKCLMVWSTNPFYSNTSVVRKLLDAREKGLKIIEVGPLMTPLTAHADIHLRLRPGTSGALALGMAHVIIEEGLLDRDFVENWTLGFEAYRSYVQEFTPSNTESITGVPAALITKAARLYAKTKPAALLTGPNATVHHTNGIQNHRALTALIGLTGNFDRKGGNHEELTVNPGSAVLVCPCVCGLYSRRRCQGTVLRATSPKPSELVARRRRCC